MVTLVGSQDPAVEFNARGRGDLLDSNERTYIIVELWSSNEPSS